MSFTLKNIVPVLQAKWIGNQPNTIIENISIDSRSLQNGPTTLFFAIVGPNNDAHIYIEELIAKGVRNFVVTHPIEPFLDQANFLVVSDTLDSLQKFATYHRCLFDFP